MIQEELEACPDSVIDNSVKFISVVEDKHGLLLSSAGSDFLM